MPWDQRKAIRQKIAIALSLEVSSIYCPEVIAPNIVLLIEEIEKSNFNEFLCMCGNKSTNESTWRAHIQDKHLKVKECTYIFGGVYRILHRLDMNLIGNAQPRREDLIGSWTDQALRIQKLFLLRDNIGIADTKRLPPSTLYQYEKQRRYSEKAIRRLTNRENYLQYFNKPI